MGSTKVNKIFATPHKRKLVFFYYILAFDLLDWAINLEKSGYIYILVVIRCYLLNQGSNCIYRNGGIPEVYTVNHAYLSCQGTPWRWKCLTIWYWHIIVMMIFRETVNCTYIFISGQDTSTRYFIKIDCIYYNGGIPEVNMVSHARLSCLPGDGHVWWCYFSSKIIVVINFFFTRRKVVFWNCVNGWLDIHIYF